MNLVGGHIHTSLIHAKRGALAAIDGSARLSAAKPTALRMYPVSAPEDNFGISVYYTPFDAVNLDAKVVLIGITPGASQMHRAWTAARSANQLNGTPSRAAATGCL